MLCEAEIAQLSFIFIFLSILVVPFFKISEICSVKYIKNMFKNIHPWAEASVTVSLHFKWIGIYQFLISYSKKLRYHCTSKMKFSIKDFLRKCDQIRKKIRSWSHLLKKSIIESFIFCAVQYFILHTKIAVTQDWLSLELQTWCVAQFSTTSTIQKTWKNTLGGMFLLVELQARACNFTKSSTPP